MGEAREIASLANDQRKGSKGGNFGSTERAKNSPICFAAGQRSSQECRVGTQISEIQRPGCAPR